MKVIFMLPDLGAGGAERVVTILAQGMCRRKIAVDIVLFLSDRIQYDVPDGVRIVKMNASSLSRLQRLSILRSYLKKQLKEDKHIVVIPFQELCLIYALLAAKGWPIGVVACERNDPYQKGRDGWSRLKAMLPFVLADQCVFQTPEAQAYYGKCVKKKSRVIVNPAAMPEALQWHGIGSKTIVSIGRLDPQKNQKMLIDAFALVHTRYPEYSLDIYGEGELREQLQRQIDDLGLRNAVNLRGYTKAIHQRLQNARLFVLSSDYEGMSNALIEALAMGVPTISTDHPIGGARMLIENGVNGILTPTGDHRAFAQAMADLLAHPEYACRLSECSQRIRKQMSPDEIVEQWLRVASSAIRSC